MSVSKRESKRDNTETRRHIKAIQRRIDWLAKRIENYREGGSASRDKVERAALVFALKIIEEWVGADPGKDPAQNDRSERFGQDRRQH